VTIPPIVTAAAIIRLFLTMASTDNAENITFMHDLKTDPEDARGPIPCDKPGDVTKLEDTGPLDGGAAA